MAAKMPKPSGLAPTMATIDSSHHEIAVTVIRRQTALDGQPPVFVHGVLYRVDSAGLWRPFDQLEKFIGENVNGQKLCRTRGHYRAIADHVRDLQRDDEFFEHAATGVCTPTGFIQLDVKAAGISKAALTPAHHQQYMLPASPDKQAKMPLFQGLLDTALDPEQIALLQQMFGGALFGIVALWHLVFLFLGPGRTGKSTVLRILEAIFDPASVSALSPYRWDSEYYTVQLAGRLLNIVGEVDPDRPLPAADFKNIVGRDLVAGRHPTHRPVFFRNTATHVFAGNSLPVTRDRTDAFFARWICLDFRNPIPREKRIPDLAERIIADELPAVLYWACQGAVKLARAGRFMETNAHRGLMARWRREANPVEQFLHDDEWVNLDDSLSLGLCPLKSEFYPAFKNWCAETGHKAPGRNKALALLEGAGVEFQRPHASAPIHIKGVRFIK